jgi:hypothetical protein
LLQTTHFTSRYLANNFKLKDNFLYPWVFKIHTRLIIAEQRVDKGTNINQNQCAYSAPKLYLRIKHYTELNLYCAYMCLLLLIIENDRIRVINDSGLGDVIVESVGDVVILSSGARWLSATLIREKCLSLYREDRRSRTFKARTHAGKMNEISALA